MKIKPNTLTDMVSRLNVTLKHLRERNPNRCYVLSVGDLRDLWHFIYAETTYDISHPRFNGRERAFTYDPTFPLYPDGTNDTTMLTALKAAYQLAS